MRWGGIIVIVLIALAASVTPLVLGVNAQNANDKATTAQKALAPAQQKANLGDSLGNKITVACTDKAIKAQLIALGACQTANAIHQVQVPGTPGRNGVNGQNGVPGRGITNTFISGGHLNVVFTDGTVQDVGVVMGAKGDKGSTGTAGKNAPPPVSIVSTALGGPSGTDLVINYSDNTSADVGNVVGPKGDIGDTGQTGAQGSKGDKGDPGNPGRGVRSVQISNAGELTVNYDDGTSSDAGQVPAGPQGVSIQSVALDSSGSTGCELVFTLIDPKDGSTSTQDVAVNPAVCPVSPPPPTDTSTPPTSGP